jgi:hypothetical protein
VFAYHMLFAVRKLSDEGIIIIIIILIIIIINTPNSHSIQIGLTG